MRVFVKEFLYVYENRLLLNLQNHLSLQLLLPIIQDFLKPIIKYMIFILIQKMVIKSLLVEFSLVFVWKGKQRLVQIVSTT